MYEYTHFIQINTLLQLYLGGRILLSLFLVQLASHSLWLHLGVEPARDSRAVLTLLRSYVALVIDL